MCSLGLAWHALINVPFLPFLNTPCAPTPGDTCSVTWTVGTPGGLLPFLWTGR